MYRRSVIFVLCLGLAAVGPVPLSACAALANLPADCQPQPDCHSLMAMGEAAASVEAAPSNSCCQVSSAPLPEARTKVVAPEAAAPTNLDEQPLPIDLPAAHATVEIVLADFSPPERQPLLCVFLI